MVETPAKAYQNGLQQSGWQGTDLPRMNALVLMAAGLILASRLAYANSSAVVQGSHMTFATRNASVAFDPSDGLTLKVGNHSMSCFRVGDETSGSLVVSTGAELAVIPYTYMNGRLQMDEGRFDQVTRAFIDSLPPGSIAALR